MLNEDNLNFMRSLLPGVDASYYGLISGICDWYESYGYLTNKQYTSIMTTARKQRRDVPATLDETIRDSEPIAPSPSSLVETRRVVRELLRQMAGLLTAAAEELR